MACTQGTWIISKDGCRYCEELVGLMEREGIPFKKLNVVVSREDATKFFQSLVPTDPHIVTKWNRTYPLWIDHGVYRGGCSDFKQSLFQQSDDDF